MNEEPKDVTYLRKKKLTLEKRIFNCPFTCYLFPVLKPTHTSIRFSGSSYTFIIASSRRRHYPDPLNKGINLSRINYLLQQLKGTP